VAVRLTGTSGQYLRRTANVNGVFSLQGWARLEVSQAGSYRAICGVESGATTASSWFQLLIDSSNNFGPRDGGGLIAFASQPAVGDAFAFALTRSGSGGGTLLGYWRALNSSVWVTATAGDFSSDPTGGAVFVGSTSYDNPANASFWNVKLWDRVLTPAELLIESFYRKPQFPSSLNFWWPLDRHDDVNDYGGNARAATVGGTLTTNDGAHGLWRPRRKYFLAPAASGLTLNSAAEIITLTTPSSSISEGRSLNSAAEIITLTTPSSSIGGSLSLSGPPAIITLTTPSSSLQLGTQVAPFVVGVVARKAKKKKKATAAAMRVLDELEQTPELEQSQKIADAKRRVIAIVGSDSSTPDAVNRAVRALEDAIEYTLMQLLSRIGTRR
jgi:hypothetical protein